MLRVGVRADLWGTFPRHYNGISIHQASHFGSLDPTFTAPSQSLRSISESDLHSRLTRGFKQPPASTAVMNVTRRAKDTLFTRLTNILGDRRRCVGDGELEEGERKELKPRVFYDLFRETCGSDLEFDASVREKVIGRGP